MVETTLMGMWHGIYDRRDNGFFRYSVSRDWKVPHYEKMLVSNASLAMAYLEAFQVTRRKTYRAAVDGILDYLVSTMFCRDEGLFFASQDADEPYYHMSWKERGVTAPPPIDRTLYSGWNALAAHSLLQASNVLGNSEHREIGANILERLWLETWTSDGGLGRLAGQSGEAPPILADQLISCGPGWRCTKPRAGGNASSGRWKSPGPSRTYSGHPVAAATTAPHRGPSRPGSSPGSSRCWKTPAGPRR